MSIYKVILSGLPFKLARNRMTQRTCLNSLSLLRHLVHGGSTFKKFAIASQLAELCELFCR